MNRLTETLLNSPAIPYKVSKLVELQTQLRVLHWQTTSHAQHEAFGKTYDSLNDLIDDFVEAFQGVYGRISFEGIQIILFDMAPMSTNISIQDYLNGHITLLKGISNEIEDTNLLNLRDEMLQALNKLHYLLTLS